MIEIREKMAKRRPKRVAAVELSMQARSCFFRWLCRVESENEVDAGAPHVTQDVGCLVSQSTWIYIHTQEVNKSTVRRRRRFAL